jgi:preprotein translocase subunit SecG
MGEITMKILMIFLGVASIVLICSILLQQGKSAGLSGAIGGGAEQLFGKKKARGYESILNKISTVCAVLYIVLSLVIVTLE